MITTLRLIILFLTGIINAKTDSKKRLIYHWVTIPTIVIGIILSCIDFGFSYLLLYYFTLLVLISLFLIILAEINIIGGGDCFALIGIFALVPFRQGWITNIFVFRLIVVSFILLFCYAFFIALAKKFLNKNDILTVPYGIYILLSSIICVFI